MSAPFRNLPLAALLVGVVLLVCTSQTQAQSPELPKVQFSTDNYTVDEKGGTAQITVVRVGPTSPAVKATFNTKPGTATPGSDYTETTVLLDFASGETSKTVSVPINYLSEVEPNETVLLELINLEGAELGTPGTAVLTILDADAPIAPWIVEVAVTPSVKENQSAVLTGTISHPTLGELLRVDVDWGDGSFETQYYTNETGLVNFVLVHLYKDDNPTATSFDVDAVKVTVTDSANNEDDEGLQMAVENEAPVIDDLTASLPDGEGIVTLTCTFEDPGSDDTHTVEIVWGDGSEPETFMLNVGDRSFQKPHKYEGEAPEGGYFIVVKVTDDDGGEGTKGVKVPNRTIWGDVTRDGNVDEKDEPTKLKMEHGVVVIADLEDVYTDEGVKDDKGAVKIAPEKARRREIKVKTTDKKPAKVKRSSDSLLLFDKAEGGTELAFDLGEETLLEHDKSYWLQGGKTPSKSVRDQSLEVREDKAGSLVEDTLKITVLWVKIEGIVEGKMSKPPMYSRHKLVVDAQGHDKLGVQKTLLEGKTHQGRGIIEVQGKISATNMDQSSFPGVKLTTGLGKEGDNQATADFGFVFRRYTSTRNYKNYTSPLQGHDYKVDDSNPIWQDVDPDPDKAKKNMYIIDNDGPELLLEAGRYFHSTRSNFWEYVVFKYDTKGPPERASKRMKWSFTGDVTYGYDLELVFIRGKSNDNSGYNEVYRAKHLTTLESVNVPKPNITAAYVEKKKGKAGAKTLKLQPDPKKFVVIEIEGSGLMGEVVLKKGDVEIPVRFTLSKEAEDDPLYSYSTQIMAVFENFNDKKWVGKDYELIIRNKKYNTAQNKLVDQSHSIGGFEIVE